MNWTTYLNRKLYRVPLALSAIIVCSAVLLNLPHDCMQRRVWKGQAVNQYAYWQLDSIRSNHRIAINSLGWEQDYFIGRVAGWPETINLHSVTEGTATELWSALTHNACDLMAMAALAFFAPIAGQWLILTIVAFYRKKLGWSKAIIVSSTLFCLTGSTVGCHRFVLSTDEFDQEMSERGTLGFATYLPARLANILPVPLSQPFLKLESAVANRLRPPAIDQLVTQSSLRRLVLQDCLINRHQLQQLVEHSSLEQLRLERCHFEPSRASNKVATWRISDLALVDCSGLENISSELSHAKSLRRCMLQGSAESLQAIVAALHRGSLEQLELVLSRETLTPHVGTQVVATESTETELAATAMIKLSEFSKLHSLSLFNTSESASSVPILLSIADCERLDLVAVDESRAWDLALARLPRFKQLVSHFEKPGRYGCKGNSLAAVRSLTMTDLPSISRLALLSSNLERLQIDRCASLQELVLSGAFGFIGLERSSQWQGRPQRHTSLANHFSSILGQQPWLSQLRMIDLSHNSLVDADLSWLTQLPKLQTLVLDHTGIEVSQLNSAMPNETLTHLSLRRSKLSSSELNSILNQFPNLAIARFYPAQIDELVVVDRPELQSLGLGPECAAKTVQIVNCPKLSDSLRFTEPLTKLHIENVPQLAALTIDHPVPLGTVLDGVRQLKQVGLSGECLTDQHLKSITLCNQLESLSFTAPHVSPAALRRIGGLKSLSVLQLPNTQLNDQTVQAWGAMPSLFEVDFAHTAVTEHSVSALAQSNHLKKLVLSDTDVSGSNLQAIQSFPKLFCLELSGIQIDPQELASLLHSTKFDRLDLSTISLNSELVDVLCSHVGGHVTTLILADCDIAPADIQRIANRHPRLTIETSSATVSASFPLIEI